MSSRSVLKLDEFFQILLLSASAVISQVNLTSFLLTSWYFLVTGKFYLSLIISLSGGFNVTGDTVSTVNTLSVSSIPIVIVIWFLRSVKSFISVIIVFDLSVSLPSVSAVSINSLLSCRFCCSSLDAFAKWPFSLHLWHFKSRAGICDSDSNLGRHNICNFGLCVSILTLSNFVRCMLFYV